jgi:hypothetical protein
MSVTEKQLVEQAILSAVLWTSPGGAPYSLKNLINDWSQQHAVSQLPRVVQHPERAVAFIRGRVSSSVRASVVRALEERERESRKDRGLVTPERMAKGDLSCDRDSDSSGVVTGAQQVDRSVAARMLAEGLLRPEHETAVRRFRALREAYESLFYARQGRQAIEGRLAHTGERLMADDYLWLRKRQSPFDREAVDFACFTQAYDWTFELVRRRAGKYGRAFDRLADLLGELDGEREPQETACAGGPFMAP